MEKKWYKTKWGIAAIILLFPLFLMWYLSRLIWKKDWSVQKRIIAISLLWGIVLISGFVLDYQEAKEIVDCKTQDGKTIKLSKESCNELTIATAIEAKTVNTSVQVEQPTQAPTSTPKPVEKYNIVVTSQIVKKVDGKYRYFFDIRNHDTKPFEGDVTILLFNDLYDNQLAGDTFSTKAPIQQDLGTSVYTDANTGPVSEHGENGITKFKYTVKKGKDIVHTGSGLIIDSFEDTDNYDWDALLEEYN